MHINCWINKLTALNASNGIPLPNKKEQTTEACNDIDEPQKHLLNERRDKWLYIIIPIT